MAAATDKFKKVGFSTATSLAAPGHTAGGTSITVGSTTNWPTDTGVTFAIDRVELVGGEEEQVAGSYTLWQGTVTGATTIANMALHANSPNSDQNYSAGSLTRVYIPISAGLHNDVMDGILTHANQDGTLITQAVRNALSLGTGTITGWEVGALPDVSTVTHNGNRSYDVAFASSITSTLSEGMRLQFTKTVAGNGYMGGAFNGSSHYFTRTAAAPLNGTLATVTNNFTIEAVVQPTSYADSSIVARADSTPNNRLAMAMAPSGQILFYVGNGGAGNTRIATTYQSLPLNKKTHIAASWTSGTVVIYFDGVAVPHAVTTAGTAPTTAGTGGDFSIGRLGAYAGGYFPGYISNVAVFDAVLSASTIKEHATYKLTGSETNCIGAWSLDNTANDQSSAANNLTATGGVGYTAQTPHGQLGNGVETTKSVGLVMNVSGSTATVQVPEGCTIPTSGGITSVAYSTQANPYGWVSDKGRWALLSISKSDMTTASSTYVSSNWQITAPIGNWGASLNSIIGTTDTATNTDVGGEFALSTSTSTVSNSRLHRQFYENTASATNHTLVMNMFVSDDITLTTQTTYYAILKTVGATTARYYGNQAEGVLRLIPSSL